MQTDFVWHRYFLLWDPFRLVRLPPSVFTGHIPRIPRIPDEHHCPIWKRLMGARLGLLFDIPDRRFAGLDQAGCTLFMFLPGFSPFAGFATGFLMLGRVHSSHSLLVSNGPCEIGFVPRSCGVQGTLMTHCERTCCSTCFAPVHSLMHRAITNPT